MTYKSAKRLWSLKLFIRYSSLVPFVAEQHICPAFMSPFRVCTVWFDKHCTVLKCPGMDVFSAPSNATHRHLDLWQAKTNGLKSFQNNFLKQTVNLSRLNMQNLWPNTRATDQTEFRRDPWWISCTSLFTETWNQWFCGPWGPNVCVAPLADYTILPLSQHIR